MSRHFKRHGPVLSPAEQKRQGRVVNAAREALVSTDAVRLFLNSHHTGLAGRPLDLAVASDAGLIAVEAAVALAGRNAETAGDGS